MNISSLQDQTQNNGKWNNAAETSNLSRATTYEKYFVKLAPESPLRISTEYLLDDSSNYSFQNYETDICKDSSDYESSDANSSHTFRFPIRSVVIEEYDLASDSLSDTNSSSTSGTDDFMEDASAVHSKIKFSTSDECILADTEEDSDGSADRELEPADYWKCVKCNNLQNNPLYRYCERCYQVRKSLFPPRPRRQKSRAESNRKRKMAQPIEGYSSGKLESDSDASSPPVPKKIALSPRSSDRLTSPKNGNQLNNKDKLNSESNKHANSAGELSCNNNTSSDGDEDEIEINLIPSSSIEISNIQIKSTSMVLMTSHDSDFYNNLKLENKNIQNVFRQESFCPKRPISQDSGMSSCQDSSPEFPLSLDIEDGFLEPSASSGSAQSFDSQNDSPVSQALTQIQQDSDDDTDNDRILTMAEKFTKERRGKAKQQSSISHSQSLQTRPSSYTDSQSDDVNDSNLGLCRFCMVNPKNGVFVHNKCLHLCCCYKCAVKVWKKRKSCPICNGKIKSVTKLFVH